MVLLKTLHIICAICWLGNFVVTGVWSVRAVLSRETALRRFAAREIAFTDILFTLLFGTAVVISGIVLAQIESVAVLATTWTRDALIAVVASGVAWIALLIPLEIRMVRAVSSDEAAFMRMFAIWNVIGWAITVVLFAVVYLMVAKPA